MGLLLIIALYFVGCYHYVMNNLILRSGLFLALCLLLGCQSTKAVVNYASENVVSYRFKVYDFTLRTSLPVEVRDLAAKHCAKYGKNAIYRGGKPTNALSSEEIHDFTCERGKVEVID